MCPTFFARNEASQYKLLGMNRLYRNNKEKISMQEERLSETNAGYSSECLGIQKRSTIRGEDVKVPCQNILKDKPAFIKRLIKVLVAKNLFLVHSSSCSNSRLV